MELFVPGRICLFGEHADWAGGYRRINADLEKGYTIIAGTNQGLYARVSPHPGKLIFRPTLDDGTSKEPLELPMEREQLLETASSGGFYSYAAGVAYQILTHYRVRGVEIDNYRTDLPVKKGLSSSAAACVLVARAFNRVYDLKMTTRGEMEYAYRGEITTPSRCGRMDQGCAYGNRPVMMTFDGDQVDVDEVAVTEDLHFVIVDLQAEKDTQEILKKLNQCYPFAEDGLSEGVQRYLGEINADITHEAAEAIEAGDAERVGELMNRAQEAFDRYLRPACPSELDAPVLHKVLEYGPIQDYIYGGKCVGSGGDGSAQFIAKDEESRKKLIETLESDLDVECLRLSLNREKSIRKAVIPAAGYGTRLFPATKAVKKELFPVVDSDGWAKPALLLLLEEVLGAGLGQAGIVIQEEDQGVMEEALCVPPGPEYFSKLSNESQDYWAQMEEVGNRTSFIIQNEQEGLGHALYCARDWIGDEPFLFMLGDHLYQSTNENSCIEQMLEAYRRVGHSVVGLKATPEDAVHRFGCVAGRWEGNSSLLHVTEVREKPSAEYARENLRVEGLPEGQYLSFFGIYVLTPEILNCLQENISNNIREAGEFQLTTCLDMLRRREGLAGYLVEGKRFDIGVPQSYRETVKDYPSFQ